MSVGDDCYLMDTDYLGEDIPEWIAVGSKLKHVKDYFECNHFCDLERKCQAFTYVADENHKYYKHCFLKRRVPEERNMISTNNFVSGKKSCFQEKFRKLQKQGKPY